MSKRSIHYRMAERKRAKRVYNLRVRLGLCRDCGAESKPRVLCPECAEKRNVRNRERRLNAWYARYRGRWVDG